MPAQKPARHQRLFRRAQLQLAIDSCFRSRRSRVGFRCRDGRRSELPVPFVFNGVCSEVNMEHLDLDLVSISKQQFRANQRSGAFQALEEIKLKLKRYRRSAL